MTSDLKKFQINMVLVSGFKISEPFYHHGFSLTLAGLISSSTAAKLVLFDLKLKALSI